MDNYFIVEFKNKSTSNYSNRILFGLESGGGKLRQQKTHRGSEIQIFHLGNKIADLPAWPSAFRLVGDSIYSVDYNLALLICRMAYSLNE